MLVSKIFARVGFVALFLVAVMIGVAGAILLQRYSDSLTDTEVIDEVVASPDVTPSARPARPTAMPTARILTPTPADPVCDVSRYKRGARGHILCSSVPFHLKPVATGHCLYPHLDDRDGDGLVCE